MDKIKNVAQRLGIITVEDMQRYTALELIMMIANKMNEFREIMYDYSDELQNLDDKIQYLLNEGTLEEIVQIFDRWLQDGTFEMLINQSALKDVNDRIDVINAHLPEISANVKSCGYDNTGKNDTSDIFDSLLVDNSCIYFPQGKYLIRKNILIENRSNITLDGNLSKILLDQQCELTFSNCNNITLKNMDIESKKYHLNFVNFNNCTNLVIENCTFNGNGFLNWDIIKPDTTNGTKVGLLFRACEKVIIQKCVIKGFWFRDSLDFAGCKNVKILCNNISYVGGAGIALKNSNTDFTIKDNTLENCCVYNWTNGQGGTDGVIDTYGPIEQGQTPNTHILIENNHISKFGTSGATLSGIRVSGSQYIKVKKNTIENAYVDGSNSILIQPRSRGDMYTITHNILISENTLQATHSQYFMGSLQFNGECRDVTVTKNRFNNRLTNANVWGPIIYVKTEVANLYITDNIIGDYSNAIIGIAINIKNNHKGVFVKNNSIHALKTSINIDDSSNIIVDNNNMKSTYSNVAYTNTTNLRITNNVLWGEKYIVPNEGVVLENNVLFNLEVDGN